MLRGADRGGDSPHLHRLCASAQVVWSLTESGPPLPAPDRAQVTYRGDDGVSPRALPGRARSKPKNPLRAERRMYPVLSWCLTRVLFTFAREAADASCVRRSARPRCEGGDFAMARTGQSRALTSPARPRRKEQGGSNTSEGRRGFVSARMAHAPRAAVKNRAVAARLFG